MNIDKSYLSRIIKSHEKSGYIIRKASATDLRSFELYLTLQRESAVKEFIKKDQRLKPRPSGRDTAARCRHFFNPAFSAAQYIVG